MEQEVGSETDTAFELKDWSRYFDDNYGAHYYVYNPTGHTQWDLPTGPPSDSVQATATTVNTIQSATDNPSDDHDSVEHLKLIKSSSFENPTKYTPWGLVPDTYHSDDEDIMSVPRRTRSISDDQGIRWIGSEDFLDKDGRIFSMEESVFSGEHMANEHDLNLGLLSEDLGDRENIAVKREVKIYPGGKNQDYLGLSRLYKLQRPYSNPHFQALCLLCRKNHAQDVFFPCEHHCVCRECITRENICEEKMLRKTPNGYINCSLCASVIKLILPLEGGKEVDKYWNWVYEEKVDLPKGFMKNFRHSAAVIQAVYIDDQHEEKHDQHNSSFCCIN